MIAGYLRSTLVAVFASLVLMTGVIAPAAAQRRRPA